MNQLTTMSSLLVHSASVWCSIATRWDQIWLPYTVGGGKKPSRMTACGIIIGRCVRNYSGGGVDYDGWDSLVTGCLDLY